MMGDNLRDLRRIPEAIAEFEIALAGLLPLGGKNKASRSLAHSDLVDTLLLLGKWRYRSGNFKEAATHINRAYQVWKSGPDHPYASLRAAPLWQARLLRQLGQPESALEKIKTPTPSDKDERKPPPAR